MAFAAQQWNFGSAEGGGEKDKLVAQVKAYQRTSPGHKQAWYNYCGSQGTSIYDPNRHDEETLRMFIAGTESGSISPAEGGGEKDKLVTQVKAYQRTSPGHKQAWYNYCDSQGTSIYDPNRHDEETLRMFIAGTESGSITPDPNAVATPPSWGCGGGKGWGGGGGDWWGCGCGDKGWGKGGGWGPWDMMSMMGGKGGKGGMGGMGDMGGWQGGGCGDGGFGCGGGGSADVPSGGKPGDWYCGSCGNINFSNRDSCNQCGAPRGNQARLGMRPGDWICPNCGDLVFASKSACKMCGTPRSADGGSGGCGASAGGGGGDWRATPY